MLTPLLARTEIHYRLKIIFPEGTYNRNYVTRELAASTVFAALYVGAIDGMDRFFAPKHVYRMSEEQAKDTSQAARDAFADNVMKPGFRPPGLQWYADTTREPIRDESLREGFIALGAAVERTDLPTTSSKPRYALQLSFAALFDRNLQGSAFMAAVEEWQKANLNRGALARIALVRRGAGGNAAKILVNFPNGESRHLQPGPSSEITKAVIEVFAPQFLREPAVLFVSESGNKVVSRDEDLAQRIGLDIKVDKNLPDIILVDLGPEHPLLVFVEAVASDGPINERRKNALSELAAGAGFPVEHAAFITAYLDRSGSPFKKTVDTLAWGSYAWFVSEPDGLLELSMMQRRLK